MRFFPRNLGFTQSRQPCRLFPPSPPSPAARKDRQQQPGRLGVAAMMTKTGRARSALGLCASANRDKEATKACAIYERTSHFDPHYTKYSSSNVAAGIRPSPSRTAATAAASSPRGDICMCNLSSKVCGRRSPAVPSGERISRTSAPGSGSALLSRSQMTLPLRPMSLSGRDIFVPPRFCGTLSVSFLFFVACFLFNDRRLTSALY